jgi:general secretion pathway protein N
LRWWWRGGALALAFLVAATVMFPLRLALDAAPPPAGLSVGEATGTIWSGRLRDVAWRGAALGDFEASLSPLDLLPSPALRLANGSGLLKSAIVRSDGDGFEISGAAITLPLADIVSDAPPDIAATIHEGAVSLRSGRCTRASGTIETPPAPTLGLPAFRGALTCDRGALLARLESQAGEVVLEVSPKLDSLAHRAASPALKVALLALGIPAAAPAP